MSREVEVNVMERPAVGAAGEKPNAAIGGPPTGTVMAAIVEAPRLSVTRRRTIASPDWPKVLVAVVPVASVKSPLPVRSHSSLAIVPSASVEVERNVTVWPASGDVGVNVNDATGGRSTTTFWRRVATPPRLSVTRRPTGCVPGVRNVMPAAAVKASSNWPSLSRSQAQATIWPSVSVDVDVNVTPLPGSGVTGTQVNPAAGGVFTTTVRAMTTGATGGAGTSGGTTGSGSSVTVRVTVYVPATANR